MNNINLNMLAANSDNVSYSFVPDSEILKELARTCSDQVISEIYAAGLPLIYLTEGKIVKELANGSFDIIERI